MSYIDKYISELKSIILSDDSFNEKQKNYRKMIAGLSLLPFERIRYEEYKDFCEIPKYFVKQHDINCPASRLALLQSSL